VVSTSLYRASKNPQTVKKQNNISAIGGAFSLRRRWQKSLIFDGCGVKKFAAQAF